MNPTEDFRPSPIRPDVEGVAEVIGGVAGIRFQWEELDRGAEIVDRAAEEVGQAAAHVGWIGGGLTALQFLGVGPVDSFVGTTALDSVRAVERLLHVTASELGGTADKVREARFKYDCAELFVDRRLSSLSAALNITPFLSTPLVVTKTETSHIRVSGTVEGLLSRVPEVRKEEGSAFEVLEVEGEEGPTYVVVLQGTEGGEWEAPFSAFGIAEAEFADSSYVNEAVASGLRESGAPAGANVVLVGYSQGGMHAMNLANGGAVHDNYTVSSVITAGSPTDDEAAPEGTTYLHLKHELDAVPLADMLPAKDARNQVSVYLDGPVHLEPGEEAGLGPAHKLRFYQEGARAVDASAHPSVVPVTAALGTALAGGVAKRHVFSVTRPPVLPAPPAPARTGTGKPSDNRFRNLGR